MRFMITFGDPGKPIVKIGQTHTKAFRIVIGHLTRNGKFHRWLPDVFWIIDGHRVGGD